VAGADLYQVEVVQPAPAGPGGGALTVASRQTAATSATFPVPQGLAYVLVRACNGDGCGPVGASEAIGIGPGVAQSRGAADRDADVGDRRAGAGGALQLEPRAGRRGRRHDVVSLYAQDMARAGAALDILTTANYYGAAFLAEGTRYDAIVTAHPGTPEAVTGPPVGFVVTGTSSAAPTMIAPAHQSQVAAGNVQVGWTPVAGATLYEYFVAVRGSRRRRCGG